MRIFRSENSLVYRRRHGPAWLPRPRHARGHAVDGLLGQVINEVAQVFAIVLKGYADDQALCPRDHLLVGQTARRPARYSTSAKPLRVFRNQAQPSQAVMMPAPIIKARTVKSGIWP